MTNKQKKIEQLKAVYRQAKTKKEIYQVVPEVYSAFAIALHNRGWDYDKIDSLFDDTQQIWNEYVQNGTSDHMASDCKKLTGIDIMGGLAQ